VKVLSVKNPWAYLIIYGFDFGPDIGGYIKKDVENRTWGTTYRGPLLIHASKTFDQNAYWDRSPWNIDWTDYNGHIIGKVELVDCIHDSTSRWAEPGLWHWVLKDPMPCRPVPAKGSLGLWEYTVEIELLKQEQGGDMREFNFTEGEHESAG
jgi:hypothetical protein